MGYQTRYQEPSPPPRSSPSVVHRAAPRRRMAEARDLERQGMPRECIAVVLGVDRLPLVLDAAADFEADRLLLTGWRADDRFLTAAALAARVEAIGAAGADLAALEAAGWTDPDEAARLVELMAGHPDRRVPSGVPIKATRTQHLADVPA